jgi:hypothetical protein
VQHALDPALVFLDLLGSLSDVGALMSNSTMLFSSSACWPLLPARNSTF